MLNQALDKLISDAGARQEMSAAARILVVSGFSWDDYTDPPQLWPIGP